MIPSLSTRSSFETITFQRTFRRKVFFSVFSAEEISLEQSKT